MKFFISIAIFIVFFSQDEFVMAQRFTTRNHDAKTQAPQAGDSAHGINPNQNAEKAYAALRAGRLTDARKFLSLVPPSTASDPFAMYVRATLDENATEAVDVYKEVVAENPGKPIGYDALLQLYKYHFAAGNYKSAHADYVELRKYPSLVQVPKGSGTAITESSTDQLVDPAGLKDSIQTLPDLADLRNNSKASDVSSSGEFIVQVGIFSVPDNAHKFADELRSKNIDATILTKIENEKTLYAVSAGSFPTRDAAEAFASSLKGRSINCVVVQK